MFFLPKRAEMGMVTSLSQKQLLGNTFHIMHMDHFPLPETGRNLKLLSYVLFSVFCMQAKCFFSSGRKPKSGRSDKQKHRITQVHPYIRFHRTFLSHSFDACA